MRRRSFLKWLGFGAAAVAVPAIVPKVAHAYPALQRVNPFDLDPMAIDELGRLRDEAARPDFVGYEIWHADGDLPRMRLLRAEDVYAPPDYDWRFGTQWSPTGRNPHCG